MEKSLDCDGHFENCHGRHPIHIQNVQQVDPRFCVSGHAINTCWTIVTCNQQCVSLFRLQPPDYHVGPERVSVTSVFIMLWHLWGGGC